MESLLGLTMGDVEESYRKLPSCKLQSRLQPKLHAQYMALREEGEAWAEARIAPALSKAAMKKLRSTNCVALACFLWPNAEGQRGLTFVKFCYWVVLFDDLADDPLAMGSNTERLRCFCAHILNAMFGDEDGGMARGGLSEQERMVVEVGGEWWNDVARSDPKTAMPAGLQARVEQAMRDYVMAQLPCVELRAEWEAWLQQMAIRETAPPCTLAEMLVQWRVASGAYLAAALSEYDVGVDLDEESLANPLLRELVDAVADHLNWVNNIFSFPKDTLKQETLNFLTLLHLNAMHSTTSSPPLIISPHQSFQVTLAQAWDIPAQLERRCINLTASLAKNQSSTPAAQMYADALCTLLASHITWFSHTTRYPHSNNNPHESTSQEITYNRDMNVMALP